MKNLTHVASLSVGGDATCAVLSTGALRCWGFNASGDIGNGTTQEVDLPSDTAFGGIESGVLSVAIGDEHVCVAMTSGVVECAGWNAHGELGDGNTTNSPSPIGVVVESVSSTTGPLGGVPWAVAVFSTLPVSTSFWVSE